MKKISKIRIVRLDNLNITFQVYREIKGKNNQIRKAWVQDGGFYPSLEICLKSLKEFVINNSFEIENLLEIGALLEKIKQIKVYIVDKKEIEDE